MTLSQDYTEALPALRYDVLPAPAIAATKRALLGWFAATIPATGNDFTQKFLSAMQAECANGGPSEIMSHPIETTPRTAAFLNGTVSHFVEFDDIFRDAIFPSGCPIISAALATA